MPTTTLSIGELAHETGCTIQTIRYYERIGLLPAPPRTSGRQRRYGPSHCDRLTFIRHSRALGFTLGQIRSLLALSDRPERPCEEIDQIAHKHLAAIEQRIESLQSLKIELERMIMECRGGRVSECRVIEVLSDPASSALGLRPVERGPYTSD